MDVSLLIVILLTVGSAAQSSNGCSKNALIPPGITEPLLIDIEDPVFGTIQRSYRLLLPVNYDPNIAYKFVIDFHGFTMNAKQEEDQDNIVDISGYGVILVWPNGSNDTKTGLRAWNAVGTANNTSPEYGYTCNRDREKWGVYECYDSCQQIHSDCKNPDLDQCYCFSCWSDIAFVEQLLDYLSSQLCLDLSHIHATGVSSGAMFTYQIAQSLSNIFASIISCEGAPLLGYNLAPQHPISVLDFRGKSDTVIPGNVSNSYQNLTGPYGSTWSSDGYYYASLDNITMVLNETNQCGTVDDWAHYPTVYDGIRDFYCVAPYGRDCVDGVDIVRCAGDWGHTWPLWQVQPSAYPNILYQWISEHPKANVVWLGK